MRSGELILFALVSLVISACAREKGVIAIAAPTPMLAATPQRICLGIPEDVERHCGCFPFESPLITAVSQLQVSDAIRNSVVVCSERSVAINVTPRAGLKSSIETCAKKQTDVDAAMLARALSMFDDLVLKIPKKVVDDWVSCYDNWTRVPTVPPREMTDNERAEFRGIVADLARGLLDSYQCQLLRAAVDICNEICGGHPCSEMELLPIYLKKMSGLSDADAQAVCDAIADAMKSYGMPTKATVRCTRKTPWFYTHPDSTWTDILLSPTAVADQIGLIRDVFLNQIDGYKQRTEVASAFVEAWSTMAGATSLTAFSSARARWGDLASRCQPSGCRLGLEGLPNTLSDWEPARAVIFFSWMEFFAQANAGDLARLQFSPGCRFGRMTRPDSSSQWQYRADGRCNGSGTDCQWLNTSPVRVQEAADFFARALVP